MPKGNKNRYGQGRGINNTTEIQEQDQNGATIIAIWPYVHEKMFASYFFVLLSQIFQSEQGKFRLHDENQLSTCPGTLERSDFGGVIESH